MVTGRRELLTDAARRLFFSRGYSDTKVLDVARQAGFSKRTVYLEFASKDELFGTICIEGIGLLQEALQQVLSQRPPVIEELRALGQAYLDFYRDHRDHFRMLFVVANGEIINGFAAGQIERLAELESSCIDAIARAIDRARAEGIVDRELDSWQHAVGIWGALTGVLLVEQNGRRIQLAGLPIETLYWQMFEIVLRGAAP